MFFPYKRKILKLFFGFFAFYIVFCIVDQLVLFNEIDKTLDSSYYFNREKSNKKNTPVYLVSYAGKKSVFFKNQNAQALSAINQGIDFIMMFKKNHFDEEFLNKNKKILDIECGDGLWIWKPYLILKTMEMSPKNSIIIYADSPVVFKNPITHFLEILETNDIVLLVDGNRKKNNVRKAGALIQKKYVEHFNLNYDVFSKKDHLSACFMMFKNNDISKKFVKQWLHNCEIGLLDTPLYEQTMMLITSYSLPEGIYFTDNHEIRSFVNNVHRHPNEEDKSLIPEIVSKSIG